MSGGKGFSLGFFDAADLRRTPIAVARSAGRVVAFANVWEAPPDLSIDLMRYRSDAPRGVIIWRFVELMLWGRHGDAFYDFEGLREFKNKFAPVWRPKYLASPGGLALPGVLRDLVRLIQRGPSAVAAKRRLAPGKPLA